MLEFLKDPYLLSRWAWVLGIFFFGSIYTYVAVLFSFAYYGIARVSGVSYSWPDAMLTSVFIPFFISDLPKILAVKLLGGIHCLLVVVVGIGTIVNFLRRKLDDIRRAATDLDLPPIFRPRIMRLSPVVVRPTRLSPQRGWGCGARAGV
jgi:hypothetical protein